MDTNRVKMDVYTNLPELMEVVKGTAICREIGVTSAWLNGKLHQNVNTKYSVRKFSEDDVCKLNEGVWAVARKLMDATIEYSEDRQAVIDQVKERYADVFLKQVAIRKMGWSEGKIKSCMVKTSSKGRYMTFGKQELQQLTLANREVAARMLSIEYCVSED